MAKVKPFRGVRPPKEYVEKVASKPYDVLSSEEARAEAGDNEMCLYHIIKPEIDFEPGTGERASTSPRSMTRPSRTSRSSRTRAGWSRIPRTATTSMHRPWMAAHNTDLW